MSTLLCILVISSQQYNTITELVTLQIKIDYTIYRVLQ